MPRAYLHLEPLFFFFLLCFFFFFFFFFFSFILSFSFIFFHVLSFSIIFFNFLSVSSIFFQFLSFSFIFFHFFFHFLFLCWGPKICFFQGLNVVKISLDNSFVEKSILWSVSGRWCGVPLWALF